MDLEASEMAIRAAMHQLGGVLLEKLVNSDGGGHQGAHIDCSQGHQAEFVDYRRKKIITVLAPVDVVRAYYHCATCHSGMIPKDGELDIAGTSLSPGVRRMVGHVGGKEAFEQGHLDLETLAGIAVPTKQVERVAEEIGRQVEAMAQTDRALALSGKVVPLTQPVAKLYIAIDGTGVPVIAAETEGRAGKGETGKAKTREAKLGCVFTQSKVDAKGFPIRDEASTSYVGAIETAAEFGPRIYAEALRRGLRQADKVIVLGDGAPWIWGIATEYFPFAIQCVDLFHARQHLAELSKVIYGPKSTEAKQWSDSRSDELDLSDVEAVIEAMRQIAPGDEYTRDEIRKAIDYFETNKERMRYASFRSQGLFVGSGVMEAGCKTIVGQRLKPSGMRWTVSGANKIIALRCCQLSGSWEAFWEARAAG